MTGEGPAQVANHLGIQISTNVACTCSVRTKKLEEVCKHALRKHFAASYEVHDEVHTAYHRVLAAKPAHRCNAVFA